MTASLAEVARQIVAPGKGILAADESTGTIKKRLDSIGVESTFETRRAWRELLFTTEGIEEAISGVILFDETIRQSTTGGTPFPELLRGRGILPGIKVDKGAKALALHPGEKVTEGLDGLRDRLAEYRELGAAFAKWRAVIAIGDGLPSTACIEANAEALARYAALCQEAGLVPIVEPEVLMDGPHDLATCERVTGATLHAVFAALHRHGVDLAGTLLKPNMVLSGKDSGVVDPPAVVAEATLRCFRTHVPAAVPGIVFLSGGQTEDQATANLDAMNRAAGPKPWALSFSYGRALQSSALKAWGGQADNVPAAQDAFRARALANGRAALGRWAA